MKTIIAEIPNRVDVKLLKTWTSTFRSIIPIRITCPFARVTRLAFVVTPMIFNIASSRKKLSTIFGRVDLQLARQDKVLKVDPARVNFQKQCKNSRTRITSLRQIVLILWIILPGLLL